MTKQELVEKLAALGVHPSSYSIGLLRGSECISVLREGTVWLVFYTERNRPEKIGEFATESDAYEFVLREFRGLGAG